LVVLLVAKFETVIDLNNSRMKRFLSGIFVVTILFLTPGCSSKSREAQVNSGEINHNQHEEHSRSDSKGSSTENMHHEKSSTTTKAKLTIPKKITPNQPIVLAIDIEDKAGKIAINFDNFQEKQMHLIVVSDDLSYFNHIHPSYKGNGRFEVNPSFPQPGSYTIFSDYKPFGQNEQVSVEKLSIPGSVPLPKELEKFSNTKILPGIKVNLKFSESTIKAGKEVTLMFDLNESVKNQAIKNLQPYLGEKAHLIVVKSSSPLTAFDYIHVHALKDTPNGQVHFKTVFPQLGTYKLWLQFNRNGKINTADFWVNVE
jgi:hypothetical protein